MSTAVDRWRGVEDIDAALLIAASRLLLSIVFLLTSAIRLVAAGIRVLARLLPILAGVVRATLSGASAP
ncbi:hypothetical protein [Nocardia terpenica]|uniref:Uncharacterized protein n=1 Tax=Nocardia terpenica TaxID=455432 RepID=A0A6G9YZ23_9NOCA|nr:hypothetical protein [Nocardia terpenica]QIS18361.1 hypothetical protein F6W96_08785 [Nocardia terpenica]